MMTEFDGKPFRLAPFFSERPWGRLDLRPWYADPGTSAPVGEAWLTGPACLVEDGIYAGRTLAEAVGAAGGALGEPDFPLLVKILFPADKLSVQVHPDDAMARQQGHPRGKTECWYVLEAEPGASVACGLRPGVTHPQIAEAAEDGSLEALLAHVPVSVGDMVFVDAGTMHALGAGVTLLEVQQTSDLTYRLFDYGRGRELHLEHGLRAVKIETAAGKIPPETMDGFTRLIAKPFFVVDRFDLHAGATLDLTLRGPGAIVGLAGHGSVGALPLGPGETVVSPRASLPVRADEAFSFVRCSAPAKQ